MNGVLVFPLISIKLLVGIESRVYKSFPLFFFFVPTTSLEGQQIFVNHCNGKMAPFSPLVHAGRLSGEGYAHSNAPRKRKRSPRNRGRHRVAGHHPEDLEPETSDTLGISNILSHRPHWHVQKGWAWNLTFGSNNTATGNPEHLQFPPWGTFRPRTMRPPS